MSEKAKDMAAATANGNGNLSKEELNKLTDKFKPEVLADYRLACESREASLLGRKEVLTGKAKFGIFGDGKEIPQIALAKAFKPGDIRSGYYRDQTWMMAIGQATIEQFYAQLYAHPDLEADPFSGGRQMNAHFATKMLDEDGNWLPLKDIKNSAADASPTACQMSRSLGLAQASKFYRNSPELKEEDIFSTNGDEICFVSIGDASTSEGIFWETVNAAGVLQVPLAVNIWDDGYGISVPRKYQTTKGSISDVLEGFRVNEKGEGYDIYRVSAWDYPKLVETYRKGVEKIRETHRPAIFHIVDVTQPQGHSTSGSHERYKSPERLQWEKDFDCIVKMREWLLENGIANAEELDAIEAESKERAKEAQKNAWGAYRATINEELEAVNAHLDAVASESAHAEAIQAAKNELKSTINAIRKDVMRIGKKVLRITRGEETGARDGLKVYLEHLKAKGQEFYSTHLYSETEGSALNVEEVAVEYADEPETKTGAEILNQVFDNWLTKNPKVIAFGEDVGFLGDVDQGFAGMQAKHGEHRVFDTGIREATIIGQGIGLAMRGFRPITEIQYLDYLIYGLQPIMDDLATLRYRSRGQQKAPMIVRTRGHRLEGIWHTGSPIGMILGSVRGVYVLTPRNMTQAAGMYNTMLQSDDPALIIEPLKGYRMREPQPENLRDFTVPLGKPEVLKEGEQVTIVTYGLCVQIAEEAMAQLEELGISVELIDVQTLLPFDRYGVILESLKKTNRVIFLDEDVPGGASAFMMQQVIHEQGGYFYLDSKPVCLSAKPHRSAFGSDGDYFSKPNAEDVFEAVYALMHEADPQAYPEIY